MCNSDYIDQYRLGALDGSGDDSQLDVWRQDKTNV